MFGFIKKMFGLSSSEEVTAAKADAAAPYKIEPPVVNNKVGDIVDVATVSTVAPTKKPRKPRTPAAEKAVVKKAAKPVKAAAISPVKRSKKA